MQLDLDLNATVLVFPPSRMASRVRYVAQQLDELPASETSVFWRKIAADLRSYLVASGAPEADADRSIRAFHDAVQTELCRRYFEARDFGGFP